MASSIPGPVPLPPSKYDLSTYFGRVRHCADISDPLMLLNTPHDVETAKRSVWDFKNGVVPHMTPELWRHKKVLDLTLHPDTGETVFLPFRMSSCVLSNLVVTAGMLTPGLGTAGTLFWQIANQSLNVAINISNANKSHPLTNMQIATNYAMAVTASCSVALGLNSVVPRLKNVSPGTKMVLGRLVPFAAVVSAGVANVFLMRSEELKKGIAVFDKDGRDLGSSKTAAFHAVGETAASRVINATPIMVIPPLILVKLQKSRMLKGKSKLVETMVNIGLIFGTSLVALPFALAVFPQRRTISTLALEPQFHNLKDKQGGEITEVEFNRGI
ncbi:Tricarboxylate/iron carrier [Metschnikowia bicuspidata var. bicuspidata NRRL YB-4993]|uniref:Sidoreflexin n=1 Tax=Metschnikowia bicuspidata var. bicuspidata NRRL YB-4993 TaxID=869754 RepID=A0A1A0HA29_9ASCO|nr:Tricarboxylate/iron carrier [Metschnikowia bicuspidata var. bicuspidata NRRL YB-4993]OBA20871.1 Tricarboxylate/iron carrier [Metschnikowia bicuspidata var. bicuspidata NRRL YB-4993]